MATKMRKPLTDAERKKAKAFIDVVRQKINLTLNPDTILLARQIGNGNVSRGIDHCVMEYYQTTKRERVRAN